MKKIVLIISLLLVFLAAEAKSKKILVLGDSNGAAANGWVVQLQKLRPDDTFVNLSIPGNTIGFDNAGRDTLNTLRNIDRYLARADEALGQVDMVLILLGTNDCKAEFASQREVVVPNMNKILDAIDNHYQTAPRVVLISPTPMGRDEQMDPKYHGGAARVEALVGELAVLARRRGVEFVNVHKAIKKSYPKLNVDGVHLNDVGYEFVAKTINLQI